jgi:hypothetical protein
VDEKDIETSSPPFVRYFNSPEFTAEKDLKWQVAISIENIRKVKEPFRLEWKEGCEVACTTFEGNHSEIPVVFWYGYSLTFTMNGYRLDGLPMKSLEKKIEGNQYSVELQWPVKKW